MIFNSSSITLRPVVIALVVIALAACQPQDSDTPPTSSDSAPDSWLITNVSVIDGSGAAGFPASVRISGPNIAAIGDLEVLPGENIIDGGGQVLAPGFIDTHSHADSDLFDQPDALPAVSQGITTIIAGQDGSSNFPLADFQQHLQARPAAVNFASYAGHNTIRQAVMGDNYRRVASAAEVEGMEALLLREMDAGALGLATGLEYDPGIYSDPSEVLALAKLAAQQGGRYISHIRSEDRHYEQALEEIIEIGRVTGMPVQISHIKLAMKRLWGRAPEFLATLDAARLEGIDISADIYPYEYWQSDLMVLLPGRDITDRAEVDMVLTEVAPPDGLWMTQFDPQPEYVGMTLTEIAALRDTDTSTAFMQLIAESVAMSEETGESADAIIGTSMIEEDILTLLSWSHTNVCTDGGLVDLHPRARGSYPRVLGRYVRELNRLSLEEAIHKMSGLPAAHMGITDRGLVQPGLAADLVLFDPAAIIDNATPQDPEALSTGISQVWVNGQSVFENGATSGKFPGLVIRRGAD
jgi:N-acyl-D-amino-acid deacylase